MTPAATPDDPRDTLRAWLDDNDIDVEETEGPGGSARFSFALPGTHKLQTPVRIDLDERQLSVSAFVCRNPDEEHERVYRWLLERNLRLYAVAFAVDKDGDIYLHGRLPGRLAADPDEIDRLLGAVLSTADESFNTLLEMGFESSIRKEWAWRISRGESTANLEAFRGWLESDPESRSSPE